MRTCSVCRVSFKTHWGLRQHQVIAHPETITQKCRLCDMPFVSRADLDRHVAVEDHYVRQPQRTDPSQPRLRSVVHTPPLSTQDNTKSVAPKIRSFTLHSHTTPPPSAEREVSQKAAHRAEAAKPYASERRGLQNYTIPKRKRCVPELPPPTSRTRLQKKEAKPKGSSTSSQPKGSDSITHAELLDDLSWLDSLFKDDKHSDKTE